MLGSKVGETRRKKRSRVAKILDTFGYKRKMWYIKQGQLPPPYIPSHEDIKIAYLWAEMKTFTLPELEKRMDAYFSKLHLILQEDPQEITLTHFSHWVNRL